MSEWSTEKKVDLICKAWEQRRMKELADQRQRAAEAEKKLEENKVDVTAKAEKPAHISPVRQILKSLHLA
jgi:hypothetical protein